jgi:hypothetical protein
VPPAGFIVLSTRVSKAVGSEAWQGRAYKNCPVDNFSERSQSAGQAVRIKVQFDLRAGAIAVQTF